MGRFVKNPVASGSSVSSHLVTGTTSSRPASASAGELRFNTTLNMLEFYNGGAWVQLRGGTNGKATITVDTATLDGSTTNYSMSITPEHERNVLVFIEGVFQKHSTYSVSGSTITVSVTGADAGKVLTMLHGFDIV